MCLAVHFASRCTTKSDRNPRLLCETFFLLSGLWAIAAKRDTRQATGTIGNQHRDRTCTLSSWLLRRIQSRPLVIRPTLIIAALDEGKLRVSEFDSTKNIWVTHAWIKLAILFYFRLQPMVEFEVGRTIS